VRAFVAEVDGVFDILGLDEAVRIGLRRLLVG
jgi:protein-tyrosine phosphatase